jgi:hypothetical protein
MRVRRIVMVALLALLALSGCGGGSGGGEQAFEPSVVVKWNQAGLDAIRNSAPRPTVNSRALFLLHTSMYDAWAAYSPVANGTQLGGQLRRPAGEHSDSNKRAAVSYAAYAALLRLFPEYEQQTGALTALMKSLGLPTDPATLASRDPATPAGIGNIAAGTLLDTRLNDGSNQAHNYAEMVSATYPVLYQPVNSADPAASNSAGGPTFNPARWQPLRVPNGKATDPVTGFPVAIDSDPLTYNDQKFLTPHWGAVTPFALSFGGELRPPPPPQPGSAAPYTDALGVTMSSDEAYRSQAEQIAQLTAQLTERHKVIAEYWADGPDSVTPPGHWNEFATDLSFKYRYGIDEDTKLFFALNGALMDSSIACWESKRFYDFIRPISAIRHLYFSSSLAGWAGPGLGTQTIPGAQWRPFQPLTFVTPAFSEYTSGHSTFSAAAAEILRGFSGSGQLFDGVTQVPYDRNKDGVDDFLGEFIAPANSLTIEPGLPSQPVVLRWNTLKEAADEAGYSRRYGGIHFQDGDLYGRRVGEEIGQRALKKAREYWSGLRS